MSNNSPHPIVYLGICLQIGTDLNHCILPHGSPWSEWVPGVDPFPAKPVPWFFLINSVLIACALHRSSIDNFPILFQISELQKDCVASAGVAIEKLFKNPDVETAELILEWGRVTKVSVFHTPDSYSSMLPFGHTVAHTWVWLYEYISLISF